MNLTNKIEKVFNILENYTYSIPAISWQTHISNKEIKFILDNNIIEQTGNKFTINFNSYQYCSYRLVKISGKIYTVSKRNKQFIVNKA